MKNILFLFGLLVLAPFAAHAQYGVGGNESLQTHHANAAAEVEVANRRNQSSTTSSGNYSRRRSGPMPFYRSREERAVRKNARERKKSAKEQTRINAELRKQREDVLK